MLTLGTVEALVLGRAEATAAAQVRIALEAQGLPIGPFDVLIAGTALARHATLVTRNTPKFARVTGPAVEK